MSPLDGLRRWIHRNRVSPHSGARFVVSAFDRVNACRLFCTDAAFRSTVWLRLWHGGVLHQTTSLTWLDRYPQIFSSCREYLHGRHRLRLLSFGCSTGEEVLTLRTYFPTATIVGAELNRRSLRACRRLPVDDKIRFEYSDDSVLEAAGPYDAIFCLAVLQRTPHWIDAREITSLRRIYPFAKFEERVHTFDRWLKPCGLLAIEHSQYRFTDASVAAWYRPLDAGPRMPSATVQFDSSGARLDRHESVDRVFVRLDRSHGAPASPSCDFCRCDDGGHG